jgi:RimJ/RimL family protein N-acetyltransferase
MSYPDDVPVLRDGAVSLRPHRLDDVTGVHEQCEDPLSRRWTTVPVPYSRQDAERFVTEEVPSGWAEGAWAFAVEAADDDGRARFAGTVELRDQGNRRAEIAYGSHPWVRGRGVMDRALRLLLEWGFHERRLRAVIWWASRGNWASRRTAWKLGFSCDGTVERWVTQRGDLLDGWVGVLHVDDERAPRRPWLDVPVLEGGQVRLRALGDDDLDRVVEACADERTAHWFGRMPRPYGPAEAVDYLLQVGEQLAVGAALTWAVADREDDRLLGSIGATNLKPGREAELVYWAHPDARGRGVTTQACGLVVRHCLAPSAEGGLGLQRLQVGAAVGNAASLHVIERNGFTRVGRLRRAIRLGDGALADELTYDLLRGDASLRPPG